MYQVTSSNIDRIGWHLGSLFVMFKTSDIYEYVGVPHVSFRDMLDRSKDKEFSVGKYFNQYIKSAGYKYKKLVDGEIETEMAEKEVQLVIPPLSISGLSFHEAMKLLQDRGYAHTEQDEQGNLRVVISGEWVKAFSVKEIQQAVSESGVKAFGTVQVVRE